MPELEFVGKSELVFAIVAPIGTDIDHFCDRMRTRLRQYGYDSTPLRLSEFLASLGHPLVSKPEYDRIVSGMNAGNDLRKETGRSDVLALCVASEIRRRRDASGPQFGNTAYLLRSLKHPDEAQTLRRIYGPGFYLIGLVSPRGKRHEYLTSELALTPDQATKVLERDEHETDEFGQHTRETFEMSDVFLRLDETESPSDDLWRFLDLVFGCPFVTPREDEHAMFMAYAASLKSGALGRQVGAAVTNEHGDVVATGANDVPRAGGGQYWPGDDDKRDYKLKYDSNDKEKRRIIEDVLKCLDKGDSDPMILKRSLLWEITEFGRDVHGEMEALLSCTRTGVSPRKGKLFCTTFPCHNCAKHIVASGIKKVVYIEPYPKSRALSLFEDSITEDPVKDPGKVLFAPFTGIGPRRYFDLFSLNMSSGYKVERKSGGTLFEWQRATASPRVPLLPTSYISEEELAASSLKDIFSKR